MEKFEKVTELIQEFYKIEGKNFPNEIFAVLKKSLILAPVTLFFQTLKTLNIHIIAKFQTFLKSKKAV